MLLSNDISITYKNIKNTGSRLLYSIFITKIISSFAVDIFFTNLNNSHSLDMQAKK